jgi:hypothetical protein
MGIARCPDMNRTSQYNSGAGKKLPKMFFGMTFWYDIRVTYPLHRIKELDLPRGASYTAHASQIVMQVNGEARLELELQDKVVCTTGGNCGIGRATARAFVTELYAQPSSLEKSG